MVKNSEILIFALFNTEIKIGDNLDPTHFSASELRRGDLSLARRLVTPFNVFQQSVVQPKVAAGSSFDGVAVANAASLIEIIETVQGLHPVKRLRGVCVLDKVEPGDHDGHASLWTCVEHDDLSPNQKKNIRAALTADLADAFSVLQDLASVY